MEKENAVSNRSGALMIELDMRYFDFRLALKRKCKRSSKQIHIHPVSSQQKILQTQTFSEMVVYLIRRIFWISCFAVVSYCSPITNEDDAALYLKRFGYLEESSDQETLSTIKQETVSSAIMDFQKFSGLRETGEFDDETIAMMNLPRCGVKDKIGRSLTKKCRILKGSKWRVNGLTYHLSNYPSRSIDNTIVKNEIAKAFKIWNDVTRLKFIEKLTGQVNINIKIDFRRHDGGYPFDGPGNILANSFSRHNGGDVHFNDEEIWTINETFGINLFQVAAHEFGHSLGLLHSDEKRALMAPFYMGYVPGFQLHCDDIEAIKALYRPPADTMHAPDLCEDGAIDAITRIQSGSSYVFKGDFYWKILDNAIAEGYPRKISDDWDGLEGNLDASTTWSSGKTYFFKGKYYWRFTNKNMDSGFPKLIVDGWKGMPDSLDAALVWGGNDKTYFFKGDKYWRYDIYSKPHVHENYPKKVTEWGWQLSDGIDAAVKWENNITYFFKGDQYYRFDDETDEIMVYDPPYPRPTATSWFGCP